jgi:hypothetical protein
MAIRPTETCSRWGESVASVPEKETVVPPGNAADAWGAAGTASAAVILVADS